MEEECSVLEDCAEMKLPLPELPWDLWGTILYRLLCYLGLLALLVQDVLHLHLCLFCSVIPLFYYYINISNQ